MNQLLQGHSSAHGTLVTSRDLFFVGSLQRRVKIGEQNCQNSQSPPRLRSITVLSLQREEDKKTINLARRWRENFDADVREVANLFYISFWKLSAWVYVLMKFLLCLWRSKIKLKLSGTLITPVCFSPIKIVYLCVIVSEGNVFSVITWLAGYLPKVSIIWYSITECLFNRPDAARTIATFSYRC
jgi:hypothetical protein